MAFEIIGPNSRVDIEDEDQKIFQMPEQFNLQLPIVKMLWHKFYEDPKVSSGQMQQLREEIAQLQEVYQNKLKEKLIKEKKISAKNPQVVDGILAGILANDSLLKKFQELIVLCDDVINANVSLECVSD